VSECATIVMKMMLQPMQQTVVGNLDPHRLSVRPAWP